MIVSVYQARFEYEKSDYYGGTPSILGGKIHTSRRNTTGETSGQQYQNKEASPIAAITVVLFIIYDGASQRD